MTDRFKGFLVTLEKELREDDAEQILTALKMIKGVIQVTPYVKGMEDYMSEEKGKLDSAKKIIGFIVQEIYGSKQGL